MKSHKITVVAGKGGALKIAIAGKNGARKLVTLKQYNAMMSKRSPCSGVVSTTRRAKKASGYLASLADGASSVWNVLGGAKAAGFGYPISLAADLDAASLRRDVLAVAKDFSSVIERPAD